MDKSPLIFYSKPEVPYGRKQTMRLFPQRSPSYRNKCTGGREGESGCEMVKLGSGEVTKLLNSHYSEVQTDGSFKMEEGTLVQKL